MFINAISAKLMDASSVILSKPIRVYGLNTYTISSDFISWGDNYNHTISDIAVDFGKRSSGVGDKIFLCGDDKISVYDFGLLYTIFTAMVSAQAELGRDFTVIEATTSREDVCALWVGNDLILYSTVHNLIIPLDNSEVETLCSGKRLECVNFCNQEKYLIERERIEFFFTDAQKKELFCRLRIDSNTQRFYSKYFEQASQNTKDKSLPWDSESTLGKLVSAVGSRLPIKEVLRKYHDNVVVEALSDYERLLVTPSNCCGEIKSIEELRKLYGHIYYSDKDEVILVVNYHSGMLVYHPCFPGDYVDNLHIDTNPDFTKFYDVSSECQGIIRYANTVVTRPLTAAQLDIKVYNKIADALVEMSLPRRSFISSLGHVVIPEKILEAAFEYGFGADLFCIVPVGKVGEAVVCLTSEGKLEATYPRGWSTSDAFYDITEVIAHVEH